MADARLHQISPLLGALQRRLALIISPTALRLFTTKVFPLLLASTLAAPIIAVVQDFSVLSVTTTFSLVIASVVSMTIDSLLLSSALMSTLATLISQLGPTTCTLCAKGRLE